EYSNYVPVNILLIRWNTFKKINHATFYGRISLLIYVLQHTLVSAFAILLIGMITDLDRAGFSRLPLTGALASTMVSGAIDANTLSAIDQMGAIWTGGGTLIAWSTLIAHRSILWDICDGFTSQKTLSLLSLGSFLQHLQRYMVRIRNNSISDP